MFTVLASEKDPRGWKETEDPKEIKDDDENLKNWKNEALKEIGAVCEKKQVEDLEEIKNNNKEKSDKGKPYSYPKTKLGIDQVIWTQ